MKFKKKKTVFDIFFLFDANLKVNAQHMCVEYMYRASLKKLTSKRSKYVSRIHFSLSIKTFGEYSTHTHTHTLNPSLYI